MNHNIIFVTIKPTLTESIKEIFKNETVVTFSEYNYIKAYNSFLTTVNKETNKDIIVFLFNESDVKGNVYELIDKLHHHTKYNCMVYEYSGDEFDPDNIRKEIENARSLALQAVINKYSVGALLNDFNSYIAETQTRQLLETGFNSLDYAIGGGLYPKLYVLGAESSVGKTTLLLQIADNVAKSGNDVIIFSLEMQKEEIMARSMSRESYIANTRNETNCFTEISILNAYNYEKFSNEQKLSLLNAQRIYESYAKDHIFIREGRHTIDEIYSFVADFIEITGKKPLIIVDYLQLIAPKDAKTDTRYNINYSVDRLKEIRSKFKTPVFVISSFNRSSYGTEKGNDSFKESGEIEYTADCTMVLDLQYERNEKNVSQNRINYMNAMRGENGIRKVYVKFLKNRGNPVGTEIHFNYCPKYNFFKESYSTLDDE